MLRPLTPPTFVLIPPTFLLRLLLYRTHFSRGSRRIPTCCITVSAQPRAKAFLHDLFGSLARREAGSIVTDEWNAAVTIRKLFPQVAMGRLAATKKAKSWRPRPDSWN